MSTSLFTCEAQSAVILVSDDPLYALGPVLVADDVAEAYEAMAAFVDALGRSPDQIPTIALMTEWQAFLSVVSGRVLAPLDAISDGAGGDGQHLHEETIAEAVQTPETPAGGSEDYSPAAGGEAEDSPPPASASEIPTPPIGGEDDEEPEPDEDDGPDLAARIAEARHTPAKDEYAECWACHGEMTVDVGGQKMACAACRGTGRIAAPAQQGA